MKLVDARKVLSKLNEDNDDEELVYELEKYNISKPRKKTNGSIINNTNTQNINQNYSQQLLQTRVAVNRESSEPGSEYDGG